MQHTSNKAIVTHFNKEFIENGNAIIFEEVIAENVINHTAPAGTDRGKDGMRHFLMNVLRKGFPDLRAELFDQVAEGDKVVTRKAFEGTHLGEFMGIPPTGKKVIIQVIDIIRLENGKYAEHWAMSNIPEVLQQLSGQS